MFVFVCTTQRCSPITKRCEQCNLVGIVNQWIHIYVNIYMCVYVYIHMYICVCTYERCMGWLGLVGSLKLQISFAEYSLVYRALLQKRPIIFRSLLIEATP